MPHPLPFSGRPPTHTAKTGGPNQRQFPVQTTIKVVVRRTQTLEAACQSTPSPTPRIIHQHIPSSLQEPSQGFNAKLPNTQFLDSDMIIRTLPCPRTPATPISFLPHTFGFSRKVQRISRFCQHRWHQRSIDNDIYSRLLLQTS